MITNSDITYYHKGLNALDKIETWGPVYFSKVWKFGGKGGVNNVGMQESNQVTVRIPMEYVDDTSLFNIGDIIAIGNTGEIETQQDLDGIEHYVINSVTINNFGNNSHVHLVGN